MNDIVKVCKKHGELTREKCTKGKRIRCKICIKENLAIRYEKYREKILVYRREWRKKRKAQGFFQQKPKKQRKLYDPNAEGYLWKCRIHGWLTKENLYFRKQGVVYIGASCKTCVKDKINNLYKVNTEEIKKRQKKYRLNNPEHYKKKDKERYYKDIDKTRKYARDRYAKNIEKIKINHKRYYEKHKDKIYERNKKYVEENRDAVRERQYIYNKIRYDHLKQKRKEWEERNYDKLRENNRKYLRRNCIELRDSYIKTVLLGHNGFKKVKHIPPEVIEIKRVIIKIRRKLMEKNSDKNNKHEDSQRKNVKNL